MDENGLPLTEAEAEVQELLNSVFAEIESNPSLMATLFPSERTNNVSQSVEQFPPISSMNQTLEPSTPLESEHLSIPDGGLVIQVNREVAPVLTPASESRNQALDISGFQGYGLEGASLSALDYPSQLTPIEDQMLQEGRSAGPKQLQYHDGGSLEQSSDVMASTGQTAETNPISGGAGSSMLNTSNPELAAEVYKGVIGENCEHLRINDGARPFACDYCNRRFKQKAHLKNHEKIHTREKPFPCDICKQSFKTNSEVTVHRRKHTGEKPFVCNYCNQSFKQSSHLKGHERIHTGEKLFACDICKKCFTTSSTLKNHIKIHKGEKPFICYFCKKSFRRRFHLQDHLRTHTGERPWVCGTCGQRFLVSSNLRRHGKRRHTGKTYFCYSCRRGFPTRKELNTHLKHHNTKCPLTCENLKKIYFSVSGLRHHKKKCIKVEAVEAGSFETVVRDDSETKTLYGENDTATASRDSGDTEVAGFSGNLVNTSDINTTPVVNAGPFPTPSNSTLYVIGTLEGAPSVDLDGQLSSTQDANSSGEQSNFNARDQMDFEAEGNETRQRRQ